MPPAHPAYLEGTALPVPALAHAGQSPVVKPDGSGYELSASGGLVVVRYPLAWDDPDVVYAGFDGTMADHGQVLYTPQVGDVIVGLVLVNPAAWDGSLQVCVGPGTDTIGGCFVAPLDDPYAASPVVDGLARPGQGELGFASGVMVGAGADPALVTATPTPVVFTDVTPLYVAVANSDTAPTHGTAEVVLTVLRK